MAIFAGLVIVYIIIIIYLLNQTQACVSDQLPIGVTPTLKKSGFFTSLGKHVDSPLPPALNHSDGLIGIDNYYHNGGGRQVAFYIRNGEFVRNEQYQQRDFDI